MRGMDLPAVLYIINAIMTEEENNNSNTVIDSLRDLYRSASSNLYYYSDCFLIEEEKSLRVSERKNSKIIMNVTQRCDILNMSTWCSFGLTHSVSTPTIFFLTFWEKYSRKIENNKHHQNLRPSIHHI